MYTIGMIRMIQSQSASQAKRYFTQALERSDYYIDDQELPGRLNGKLASRLGCNGNITKDRFHLLAENRNPVTGDRLTPRNLERRTVAYDINFHCPKSVSILHALAADDHILKGFEATVSETMLEIEADAKTRVRKFGKQEDRGTGELLWVEFTHQTARPVDGQAPDPHLHSHCFVFNVTWDDQEQAYKAGQFRDIKGDMPYYQARFHKRLSDTLERLGYGIRLTDSAFEIEGVPQAAIDLLSKRTDQIGRVAKDRGISSAKERDGLGARTRAGKQKHRPMADLKAAWKRQMREVSTASIQESDTPVRFTNNRDIGETDAKTCLDYALLHSFERNSVMPDRRLLAIAYKQAIGHRNIFLQEIDATFADDSSIIRIAEKGRLYCTTKSLLAEERQMLTLAQTGQGKMMPLYRKAPSLSLSGEQAEAVSHLLTTANQVSIIRGAAGTGKTTLMREAVRWMVKAGKKVTVVAPTAQAARGVLREEEFEDAETVAKLLADEALQNALEGQVLWVDEAGLLGIKDMTALLALAERQKARLILGGDTRQHGSVVRGDALRLLQTMGGIKAAEVTKIYRQRDDRYREAVSDLSKGDVRDGFARLDAMGAIKRIDPVNPNGELVSDYLTALREKKTALVISPTHKQGDAVAKDIRESLRETGRIGADEIKVPSLVNRSLTEAQKGDWRSFGAGQLIRFNQHLPGIKRGSLWRVQDVLNGKVLLNAGGSTIALPLDKAAYFEVYRETKIGLSRGDKVRITRNGFDTQQKRLNNGQALEVKSFNDEGTLVLRNEQSKAEYIVHKDFGDLAYAYCVTSHAAQGRTVDRVLIAQPSATFAATDAKQFYVSVSRGREAVTVYTDDKDALLERVNETGERRSALELAGWKAGHEEAIQRHLASAVDLKRKHRPATRMSAFNPTKGKVHEPTL